VPVGGGAQLGSGAGRCRQHNARWMCEMCGAASARELLIKGEKADTERRPGARKKETGKTRHKHTHTQALGEKRSK